MYIFTKIFVSFISAQTKSAELLVPRTRTPKDRPWENCIDLCSLCGKVEAELLFITAYIITDEKPFVKSFLTFLKNIFFERFFSLLHKLFYFFLYDKSHCVQNTQKTLRQKAQFSNLYAFRRIFYQKIV